MKRIKVIFLKDGGKFGYSTPEGETGFVYDSDIDYLIANGVIRPVPEEIQTPEKQKTGFIARLKRLIK